MIIVSACLIGINCRYDGSNLLNDALIIKIKEEGFIPVCPEQLGGLPTPRPSATIKDGTGEEVIAGKTIVVDINGKNISREFLKGAHAALTLTSYLKITTAILKDNSPSCGVHFTNSGFQRIKGSGVFTALLKREDITLFSECDF